MDEAYEFLSDFEDGFRRGFLYQTIYVYVLADIINLKFQLKFCLCTIR